MGLVTLTFDLLTLKLVIESDQMWGTFLPNLATLGLWVLEIFAMYATDGRTDKSNAYCPLPYWRGHIKVQPMTHVREIGAENRYQKTRASFWSVCHAFWYSIFPTPVFGNK